MPQITKQMEEKMLKAGFTLEQICEFNCDHANIGLLNAIIGCKLTRDQINIFLGAIRFLLPNPDENFEIKVIPEDGDLPTILVHVNDLEDKLAMRVLRAFKDMTPNVEEREKFYQYDQGSGYLALRGLQVDIDWDAADKAHPWFLKPANDETKLDGKVNE